MHYFFVLIIYIVCVAFGHSNKYPVYNHICVLHLINLYFFSVEFSVPLSSLGLLVPPLRLMSAVMWEVVRQRNIKHYEKLEEFVSMVTDAVPELMSKREGRLLSLGLRVRVRKPHDMTADCPVSCVLVKAVFYLE